MQESRTNYTAELTITVVINPQTQAHIRRIIITPLLKTTKTAKKTRILNPKTKTNPLKQTKITIIIEEIRKVDINTKLNPKNKYNQNGINE